MRRWLTRITLLLLAGALTTWAVAWGCALWSSLHDEERAFVVKEVPATVLGRVPSDWLRVPSANARVPIDYFGLHGFGVHVGHVCVYMDNPSAIERLRSNYYFTFSGWPVSAMRSEAWSSALDGGLLRKEGCTDPPAWLAQFLPFTCATGSGVIRGWLPSRPLPGGYATDTLFYASIFGMLWFVPLRVRQSLRRRGGRCLECGYDRKGLATDSPCPECGGTPRA